MRDRSYEAPGCVRITVGTREQTRRLLAALERDLEAMSQPILVFDMDGVLVDVTESYRETIARTVRALHRRRRSRASRFRSTRTRAAGMTTGSSRTTSSPTPASTSPFEEVKAHFQIHLPRQRRRTA